MLSGHRPPPRRRGKGRAKRIAVPFAIPMALGLTLGVMLAVSGGNNTHIDQSSLQATPIPSVSAPVCPAATRPAGTPASPAPAPSPSSTAASSTGTARPCPSPSSSPALRATASRGAAG